MPNPTHFAPIKVDRHRRRLWGHTRAWMSGHAELAGIAGCTLLAAAVRLGYLTHAVNAPGFSWIDPDGYFFYGRRLIDESGHWRWSLEAVEYFGYYLEPLYPTFLSLFARAADYPWPAVLVTALISALTTLAVFALGKFVHSSRAGFIAAAAYAVYLPSFALLVATRQEHVHVPLLILAAAVLAWAASTSRGLWAFGIAGLILGSAALARAMPIYFVGPACITWVLVAPDRTLGIRQGLAFLAGFLVATVPYSAYLSLETGQLTFIENRGTNIRVLDPSYGEFVSAADGTATLLDTVRMFATLFARAPIEFVSEKLDIIRGLFKLTSGRWLEWHRFYPTSSVAAVAKVGAHLLGDLPLAVGATLAPLGIAVARQRRVVAVLVLYIAVHVGITSLSGYGGPRYREPIDVFLFVLAASVLAGGWHKPARWCVGIGLCGSMLMAVYVLGSWPESLSAHADYGVVAWASSDEGRMATATGDTGFNVKSRTPLAEFRVWKLEATPPDTRLDVWVDGVHVDQITLESEERRLRYLTRQAGTFVELHPVRPAGDPPVFGIEAFDHHAGVGR